MLDLLGRRENSRSGRTGEKIIDLKKNQIGFLKKMSAHSVQPFGQL